MVSEKMMEVIGRELIIKESEKGEGELRVVLRKELRKIIVKVMKVIR